MRHDWVMAFNSLSSVDKGDRIEVNIPANDPLANIDVARWGDDILRTLVPDGYVYASKREVDGGTVLTFVPFTGR